MNPRVLELLKNPKNIQSEDLGLLKEEIHAFPYVQNIRALHLFGVHLYDKENYQKELSTTAAYTTDKKLLYQLINGKIQREPKPETAEEKQPSKTTEKAVKYSYKDKAFPIKREEPSDKKQDQYEAAASMIPPVQEIKHIHVNGERNRILFEGEENFLDETHSEVIDLESTLESGVIVTQKAEPVTENLKEEPVQEVEAENNEPSEDSEAGVEFTPELIIDEDQIDEPAEELEVENEEEVSFHEVETIIPETEITEEEEQKETVEEPATIEAEQDSEIIAEVENTDEPHAEISFHGMDEFLPDVKIQANSDDEAVAPEVSKPNVNKHEEEMRRLIEEVEKKMKEAQSAPKVDHEEPETADHEISFAETQNFHFWSTEKEEPKTAEESAPEKEEEITEQPIQNEEPEVIVEKPEEQKNVAQEVSAWKPMSLESNVPDSMISKEQTVPAPKTETPKQEEIPAVEEKREEVPVETTEESQKEAETVSEEHLTPDAEETPETAEEQHADGEVTETKIAKGEEAPVMNVSFFGSDISSLSVEKREKENIQAEEPVQEVKAQNTVQTPSDSNVPGFINTWQSWLKIDRPAEEEVVVQKEEVVVEVVEEEAVPIQEKVIEAFIENNPKISQLRDESTYIVREKNDDISHLMTETLANLYLEQKLYSKAIKAFGILKKKYPEKVAYFNSRIEEVNIIKSGK